MELQGGEVGLEKTYKKKYAPIMFTIMLPHFMINIIYQGKTQVAKCCLGESKKLKSMQKTFYRHLIIIAMKILYWLEVGGLNGLSIVMLCNLKETL